MELLTGDNDSGRRLDRILRKALPDHPLPLIHRLLRQGQVLVDGKPGKAQDRIDSGVRILIVGKKLTPRRQDAKNAKNDLGQKLEILWEGTGLIAVNKPVGISVHGPDSLDTVVRSYLADKLPPSLSFKPGPLHRLDKPSSGIVIFSTSIDGARLFTSLMRELKIKKTYLAVIEGSLKKDEIWQDELIRDKEKKKTFITHEKSINSKNAITKVKPLAKSGGFTLIKAEIVTGRTHQIRAQAAAHGYPLAKDIKYGGHKGDFFLHAWKLEFLNYSIEAPIPLAQTGCFKDYFKQKSYLQTCE